MKVAVFTTSYPRDEDDYAGRFVADAVEQLRARGIEIDVVGVAWIRRREDDDLHSVRAKTTGTASASATNA